MAFDPSSDFDIAALHAALNAQRRALGMSWPQAALAISAAFGRARNRPLSPSTLTGMTRRTVLEGDGVLQMLRWLNRTPESFTRGGPAARADGAALPAVGREEILRFDAAALYAALDAQRLERALTWKQVASEIGGISAATLTQLAKGGRTGFPHVMRMTRWLGRPAAHFTRGFDR